MRRLALIAAAGIVLTACGSSQPSISAPRPHHGVRYPVVIDSPLVFAADHPGSFRAFPKLVSPTRLRIVTIGSSTCPLVPDQLTVLGPHAMSIHLSPGAYRNSRLVAHEPPNEICTTNVGPTAMLVAIDPKQIDVYRPLTVQGVTFCRTKHCSGVTVAPLKS